MPDSVAEYRGQILSAMAGSFVGPTSGRAASPDKEPVMDNTTSQSAPSRPAPVPFVHGRHTYAGSCHCGAWRFEATLDLSAGTTQCNCTHCTKTGWWGVIVKPADFRLVQSPAPVEPGPGGFYRPRCETCGINPFGGGDLAELGGAFVSLNVRCFDGVLLAGVPIRYLDGLHDTWAQVREGTFDDPFAGARG
jgi:hypothetical protein